LGSGLKSGFEYNDGKKWGEGGSVLACFFVAGLKRISVGKCAAWQRLLLFAELFQMTNATSPYEMSKI
jgi:hypothetical protein